jgi:hypothetical protein
MNDNDRQEWVENDESLYRDWIRSKLSLRNYVRQNRKSLDEHIKRQLS